MVLLGSVPEPEVEVLVARPSKQTLKIVTIRLPSVGGTISIRMTPPDVTQLSLPLHGSGSLDSYREAITRHFIQKVTTRGGIQRILIIRVQSIIESIELRSNFENPDVDLPRRSLNRKGRSWWDDFETRTIPCKSIEGVLFQPNPCGTLEGKGKKQHALPDVLDIRELHRKVSCEITDVSMRVFFVMSKKLFVLNEGKQSVLKLKVVRGDLGNNDGILVTTVGASSN
ncbi:hypothetical protein Tco_0144376 [Tanacetum coccineum]